MRKLSICLVGMLCVLLLVPAGALAQPAQTYTPLTAAQVCESIFRIATANGEEEVITLGTGFALGDVAPVSYVATSNHVIAGYEDSLVVWMNRDHFVKCTVVVSLAQVDIAVLRLEKEINKPPLPLGSGELAERGDAIYTFGFPDYDIKDFDKAYPEDVTITTGTISKKTKLNDIEFYQIGAAINTGNSGGPLWHSGGYVIGINTIKSAISDDINGAVYIERLIEACDLESIPYLLYADLMAEPLASPVGDPSGTGGGASISKTLLIVGIALAVLAVGLLVVALLLRLRDREAEREAEYEAEYGAEHDATPPVRRAQAPERVVLRPSPAQPPTQDDDAPTRRVEIPRDPEPQDLPTRKLAHEPRPVVRALAGFFDGAVTPVGAAGMGIGRDSAVCQLVYPMEMTQVSRVHVRITYDPAEASFTLADTSTNGTYAPDGTRFERGKATRLKPGDRFCVASSEELFCVDLERD